MFSMSAARRLLRHRFAWPCSKSPILFVIFAAVAGSALAAQNGSLPAGNEAPSMDATYDAWNGFYVGGSLGGVWARSALRTTVALGSAGSYFYASTIPVIDNAGRQQSQPGGPMDVLLTGYTLQRGPWVAGLEADFGYLDLSRQSTGSAIYPCCAPTGFSISQGIRSNWLATVRPRIGITHAGLLFFLSGGVAVSDVRTSFAFTDDNSYAMASGSISHTAIGYAVGGGIAAKLASHWTITADYLLVNLGTVSASSTNLITSDGPSPENRFHYSADLRENLVRLGVNYRFY
jgi:outer membrane immunogenic protein